MCSDSPFANGTWYCTWETVNFFQVLQLVTVISRTQGTIVIWALCVAYPFLHLCPLHFFQNSGRFIALGPLAAPDFCTRNMNSGDELCKCQAGTMHCCVLGLGAAVAVMFLHQDTNPNRQPHYIMLRCHSMSDITIILDVLSLFLRVDLRIMLCCHYSKIYLGNRVLIKWFDL